MYLLFPIELTEAQAEVEVLLVARPVLQPVEALDPTMTSPVDGVDAQGTVLRSADVPATSRVIFVFNRDIFRICAVIEGKTATRTAHHSHSNANSNNRDKEDAVEAHAARTSDSTSSKTSNASMRVPTPMTTLTRSHHPQTK